MAYKTVNVDVDVELSDFDDDELIEELEQRGLDLNTKFVDGDTMRDYLTTLYNKRRLGQDYQAELDKLIYYGLGRIL
jgi:hypothetical protein